MTFPTKDFPRKISLMQKPDQQFPWKNTIENASFTRKKRAHKKNNKKTNLNSLNGKTHFKANVNSL